MLSDRRRKTKWVLNPTKKPLWTSDFSGIKFGKHIMEKMGWSAGKGLGVNEQGIQEPLRVSYKNDTKGMGFKGNDNDWIEHQDEFNNLLNQLRSSENLALVEKSNEEKNEIKSLEEKSKSSKARVHYQKFTRGKDLSRYSENDLACILGTNKTKKEKLKVQEMTNAESENNSNLETSFGVKTISGGSLEDYFKKKWIVGKVKAGNSTDAADDVAENYNPSFPTNGEKSLVPENEEKKCGKIKHKSKLNEVSQVNNEEESEINENIEEVKKIERKKRKLEVNSDNEPQSKKKKKKIKNHVLNEVFQENNFNNLAENESASQKNEDDCSTEKKIKKKKSSKLEVYNEEEPEKIEEKKHRKISKDYEGISCQHLVYNEKILSQNDEEDLGISGELVQRKKKKMKKKNEIKSIHGNQNEDELCSTKPLESADEPCLYIEPSNSKKKRREEIKKAKEEKCKDLYNFFDSSSTQIIETTEKNSLEETSVKKKKKKKDKVKLKEDSEFDINYVAQGTLTEKTCCDVEGTNLCEEENNSKGKSTKKKIKEKKNKTEENKKESNIQINEFCSDKINDVSETEGIFEVRKKKKKKEKKKEKTESIADELQREEEDVSALNKKKKNKEEEMKVKEIKYEEKHNSLLMEDKEKSESMEIKPVDVNLIENNNINEVNGGLNVKNEMEKRIERMRVSVFGEKNPDKYFPEKAPNERVLRLIKWADIAEFRGANLKEVEGYGRRKMYENKFR